MDLRIIAELLSKLQGAFPPPPEGAAPPNSRRTVEVDLRVQGHVTTTEIEATAEPKVPKK